MVFLNLRWKYAARKLLGMHDFVTNEMQYQSVQYRTPSQLKLNIYVEFTFKKY